MPNTFLTPDIIAREALMLLSNNTVISNLVHRDREQEFSGAKVGDTITIRRRANFQVDEFSTTINVQDINEGGVPLTLEKHYDISVGVSSRELTLELDEFSSRIIAPAMINMAEKVDSYVYGLANQIPTAILKAGTDTDLKDLAQVDAALLRQKVALAGRSGMVSPTRKAEMMSIDAVVRADARGDDGTALREASMGRVMGIDWYGVQGVTSHTAGTAPVTMAINNVAGYPAGTSIVDIDEAAGTSVGTLLVGDIINIAGSGQHVVTANKTGIAGEWDGLNIYPGLRAAVLNDAVVTKIASHEMNIVGDLRGISLAVVPLALPMEAGRGAMMSYNGLSIRVVVGYNQSTKSDTVSFDLLCGGKVTQPELLTRFG